MARTKNRSGVLRSRRQTRRRQSVALLAVFAASLALAACSSQSGGSDTGASDSSRSNGSASAGSVLLQVISLDHAPIRPAVEDVLRLTAEYGDVVVETYSFNSPEGDKFAAENGITEHLPIAIYVNGRSEFTVDGRTVRFESFPQGGGTGVVPEGSWTIDDLQVVLDRETG